MSNSYLYIPIVIPKYMRKKQYMAKKGRRMCDNNGYASPIWKAYWEKVDAEAAKEKE